MLKWLKAKCYYVTRGTRKQFMAIVCKACLGYVRGFFLYIQYDALGGT